MHYLWRAVDHQGEILASYVTKTRDEVAGLRFRRKALKHHGRVEAIAADGLKSYPATMCELGNEARREVLWPIGKTSWSEVLRRYGIA